jgi:hypothetical protein
MPSIRSSYGTSFLLTAFVIAVSGVDGAEQPFDQANQAEQSKLGKLGTVNFPTSCSQPAQAHFLRGLAALHSFWYPVAIDEFRESTKIEPDCMMGYWGEAMAHNHPIWGDPPETEAARKALEKIRPVGQADVFENNRAAVVQVNVSRRPLRVVVGGDLFTRAVMDSHDLDPLVLEFELISLRRDSSPVILG